MSESEAGKQAITEMERIASQTARDKAKSGRWDLDVALALSGVLILVVFLLFGGANTTIVGTIAIFGLLIAWFMGWRKGKRLYSGYYLEELRKLKHEMNRVVKEAETVEEKVQEILKERFKDN
jgi:hypothetical protein